MTGNAFVILILSYLCYAVSTLHVAPGIRTRIEKRSKRSVDGFFDMDSYILSGYGRNHELSTGPHNEIFPPEFPVYVGSGRNRADILQPLDQDLNIFRDGNSVVGISRRNGHNGRQEEYLNGVMSKDGNDYVIEPDWYHPDWSHEMAIDQGPEFAWPYHRLSKRRDRSFEGSVDYVFPPPSAMLRSRRGERTIDAVVELLVVVDNAIYRKEMRKHRHNELKALHTIKEYYTILVSMANIRFEDIKYPGLKIRVRLASIYIAKDRLSAPWAEYNIRRSRSHPGLTAIDPQRSLDDFRKWLVRNNMKLPKHDHAMAFTGYIMEKSDSAESTTGMAYISTICMTEDGWSSSLVEEMGGFSNIGTVTHELGHSLGAGHDGVGKNRACPVRYNHVMAPYGTLALNTLRNSFVFSQCSLRSFKTLLSTPQAQCVYRTRFSTQTTVSRAPPPGQILGADAQCQEVYGQRSSFCNMPGFREQLCVRLWCRMPSDPSRCVTRAQLAAAHGTTCGNHMWCKTGHCRNDPHAPAMKDCYYGDEDPAYCQSILLEDPNACQDDETRRSCCKTCATVPVEK